MTVELIQKAEEEAAKTPAHQHVYERMRDRILFGEYVPGQALTIQGLTADTQAGMTPVREAIRRLISEGAVQMLENRRLSVPILTPDHLKELVFMRAALEPELAKRAAERIGSGKIELLGTIDDKLNRAIHQGNVADYLKYNYAFHMELYAVAEAPIMAETVDRLWLRFGPSLRVVCGRFGTLNLPDKHADILEALERRDATAAGRAMHEDVEQGMKHILGVSDSIDPN